jgi:hypothetical protein
MRNLIKDLGKALEKQNESFKEVLFCNQHPSYLRQIQDIPNFDPDIFGRNFLFFTKKGHYSFAFKKERLFGYKISFINCEPPTNWEELQLLNFNKDWNNLI